MTSNDSPIEEFSGKFCKMFHNLIMEPFLCKNISLAILEISHTFIIVFMSICP